MGCGEALPAMAFPVATLGTFDGVHLGHQRVIGEAVKWAKEQGGESVVVTFDRHPRRVIEGQAPALITSVEHRLVLFERLGVDVGVVLRFDAEMARLEAEEFAEQIFFDWLRVRGVILGFDCAFGKGRCGDSDLLRRLGLPRGVEVRVCEPVHVQGRPVSSTEVRSAIERGDLDVAAAMLGRPVSLLGTVVHGSGRGHELGFPTANLDLHHEAVPPSGVYLTQTLIDGALLPSLTNIGTRPTLYRAADAAMVVEVYIEGADESLYGRDIEVRFVRRLREEIAFETIDDLIVQMEDDRRTMLSELG